MKWIGNGLLVVFFFCILVHESDSKKTADQRGPANSRDNKKGRTKPDRSHGAHSQLPSLDPLDKCGEWRGFLDFKLAFGNKTSPNSSDVAQVTKAFPAAEGEYPSYASIYVGDELQDRACGGALVGPDLVITAAHCLAGLSNRRKVYVLLGASSPHKKDHKAVLADRFCFPLNACQRDDEFLDFVFLKLKFKVKYTYYIQSACLLPDLNPANTTLLKGFVFVGFERNATGHESKIMKKSPFRRGCGDSWEDGYRWMQKSVQCYHSSRGSQPCSNDLGGPMYSLGKSGELVGRHVVVGISTFLTNEFCETKPGKPNYFIEVDRLKADLAQSMANCRDRDNIDEDYIEKRCFSPRKKDDHPSIEPSIDYDQDQDDPSRLNRYPKRPPPDLTDSLLKPVPGAEPFTTCGAKYVKSPFVGIKFGRDAGDGEFPSYVQLSYEGIEDLPELRCGGALIGPRLIVTSATCVANKRQLVAYLGLTDKSTKQYPYGTRAEVLEVCLPPNWCVNQPHFGNLAFVKLKNPVRYTSKIYPACFFPHMGVKHYSEGLGYFDSPTLSYTRNPDDAFDFYKNFSVRHFSFPKQPTDTNLCWPNEQWMDNMTSCYRADYRCTVDTGSPLYDINPDLGNRHQVIGIHVRGYILPKKPDDWCTFYKIHENHWRVPKYPVIRNESVYPTTFTDIHKARHFIEPILSNCKLSENIDPDDFEASCDEIEKNIKLLNIQPKG